jgi:hypothetical protein
VNPEESLSEFFDNQMKDPNTAWSVGSFGAIAEFMRDPDERVTFRSNGTARSAVTARGGVLVGRTNRIAAYRVRIANCARVEPSCRTVLAAATLRHEPSV